MVDATPTRGFAFPFRIDPETGGLRTASGTDKLQANLVTIILTGIGERVMRRRYGCGLRQMVQDPSDQVTWSIVQHQISKAIAEFEPRVLLQQLSVAPSRDGPGKLDVTVRYTVRRTQAVQSLSIPVAFHGR